MKATEQGSDPYSRWDASVQAVTLLAKREGKTRAKIRRKEEDVLEYVLKCVGSACGSNMQDLYILHLLHTLEEFDKRAKTQKAEAARIQIGLYWLRVGDTPNRVFFKSLRTKKDVDLISAIKGLDGRITTKEEEIRQLFVDSLSNIVGAPLDVSGDYQD